MAKDKKKKAKARAKAEQIGKAVEAQTAEMAHKIWLAGVGAYGKAYDTALANANALNKQSAELFDELVKRGEEIESDVKGRFAANEQVHKAAEAMAKANAAAREFQAEARDRFEARMDPEQRPGPVVRPASGAAVHLAVAGDQQAFVATPGEAHAEQVEGGNEALHGLIRDGLQDESEQAAGAGEVTLPQRVVTAGRQRRVEHFGNFLPRRKPFG